MVSLVPPKTIGLLGGAFNPAHEGHIHVSQCAKQLLHLDAVWWVVACDHPVKSLPSNKNFSERFEQATQLAKPYPFITISDFEKSANTRYSIDTLKILCKTYPKIDFVWLMGADNFATLHTWYQWQGILDYLPIAIFDREDHKHTALSSPFAKYFAARQQVVLENLVKTKPYGWCFLDIKKHPATSTALRS